MEKQTAIVIQNKREFESVILFLSEVKNYKYNSHGIPTYGSGLYAISIAEPFCLIPHSQQGNDCYKFIDFDVFVELSGIQHVNSIHIKLNDFVECYIEYKYNKITFANGSANETPGSVKSINHLSFDDLTKIYELYLSNK